MEISENEILKYAVQNDMIDMDIIRLQIEMDERKQLLARHMYDIWQGKDNKFYTYLPDEKKGRVQRERRTRKEIEDCIVDFYRDDVYLSDVFSAWITEKEKYSEIQPQTVSKYNNSFKRFFLKNPDAQKILHKKVKYITEDDLEDFIKSSVANLQLTKKAYADMRTLIYGMFRYAKKKKQISLSITNFMGDLDISKRSFKKVVKDKSKEVYQENEVDILTENLRTRTGDIRALGVLLLFQTGMRIGELSGLHKEDILDNSIHVCRTEVKQKNEEGRWITYVKDFPKSDAGDRYIILSDNAKKTVNMILAICDTGDFLFMENGKRIRSNAFRRKLMRVCKELNIEYRSNHKIRKTYGTMLIDSNVDEAVVAEMLGHTDIATTKKYYYFSNKGEEKKREQINRAIGMI